MKSPPTYLHKQPNVSELGTPHFVLLLPNRTTELHSLFGHNRYFLEHDRFPVLLPLISHASSSSTSSSAEVDVSELELELVVVVEED
jgi:hypothetical protein